MCYGQKTLGKETNVHRTKMTTPLHLAFKLTVEMSSVFFFNFSQSQEHFEILSHV